MFQNDKHFIVKHLIQTQIKANTVGDNEKLTYCDIKFSPIFLCYHSFTVKALNASRTVRTGTISNSFLRSLDRDL